MKKIKGFAKKYLIGFIIGIITGGVVNVIAATYFPSNDVTYDNDTSGLSSTNVQGAIDELYKTCKGIISVGGKDIETVTSGDGLYEDEYEDGKYTYKGVNPNNYVTFNNEKAGWRIISINSDGTIKIMRDASIGNIAWDTSNVYNWNRPATLNTYLNEDYYNNLTSTAQSQIVTATYYVGTIERDNNDMQDQISDEKGTTSNVKVALPTVSEYIRAGSNKVQCGTLSLNNSNYYSTCQNSDWMYNSSNWWTLSPDFSNSINVFNVSGYVGGSYSSYTNNGVRPTVTLSSEVKITGGTGTQSDPYIIE